MFLQEGPSTKKLVAPGWGHSENAKGTATFTGLDWLTGRHTTILCDSSFFWRSSFAMSLRCSLCICPTAAKQSGSLKAHLQSSQLLCVLLARPSLLSTLY